jgi:hypothetical protein
MNPKSGFLLIELMIGLTLAFFFILISAHYIIQLKNIQQVALMRIESLSLARTCAEKMIAGQPVNNSHSLYTVHVVNKPYILPKDHVTVSMNDISIGWTMHNQKHALHLHTYGSLQLDMV